MLGDFNIHIDKPDLPDVKKFNSSRVSSGLYQHIHEPTHKLGQTLDLVITCLDDQLIQDCNIVKVDSFSDHYMIH